MEKTKSAGQKLQEELLINRKNGGMILSDSEIKAVEEYCEGYKKFLDDAKTEREAVITSIELAKKHGFVEYEYGKKYVAGDKI
ncbi:MAG: aminopeptidase, partial [Oscillospiraceae bacterium]